MLAPESPDMRRAVQSGIAAMRRLHEGGYGRYTPTAPLPRLESPIEELADTIRQRPDVGLRAGGGRRGPSDVAEAIKTLSWAQVPEPRRPMLVRSRVERRRPLTGLWSVLNDKCCDEGCEGLGSQLEAARAIVRIGADEALPGVPLAKFGGLRTADRSEIEGYQSIRALIGTYGSGKDATPLSIAVFGPPGSGKSYGVEQVAASITGLQVESVTFNLSQFSSPDQIASALHAVRDVGLKGKLPLVFWDEFDATFEDRRLGWLRYFLSPMQDGAFQEQQVTHHIGRAIFVFAGGIYSTMESFAEGEGMTNDEFRAVKGPDFKSRLRGYVNIMGPNPVGNDPRRDRYHLVRRAILLRSLLERKARQVFGRPGQPHLAQIDEGVLEALLQISRYEHGARSMGAIIEMSTLTGHASFERSCLPSQAQLDAHVSGASFMEIVQQSQQQPYLGVGLLDDLAEAVYRRYCQDNGLVDAHGHPTEPWADLGEPEKESNRASVRDYQHKLATIGYVMVRQQAGQSPFTLTDAELRVLARLEHERWMDAKLAKGYVWGPDKNDDAPLPLTNPLLLPWRKLSPADQANNVKLVEAIPQLLGAQDYTCKCLRPEALAGMLGLHAEEEQEVRIAVAGHRMLAELEKITDGIANALREIGERYPNKRMVAYSPLVAGGVAMLSRAILDHPGASLIAVLPMRQEDFARDFADGEELETFQWLLGLASDVVSLPLAPSRIDAYRAGDEYIVDQSDVLITIWDGNPSQGPAGSAESFNRAMQQKMPMFHIQAGNRMPGTHEPTTLGVLQGKLVTYNLP